MKAKREEMTKEIEEVYLKRKKVFHRDIPKYAKITKLDLNRSSYQNMMVMKQIITESERDEILDKKVRRNAYCDKIVNLKKCLDA